MRLSDHEIEKVAMALAKSELTALGKKQFGEDYWRASYSTAEREAYRRKARVVLQSLDIRSKRILARGLDRERKKVAKLQAKLAAIFPTESRYDRYGEMRLIARVKGQVVLRRPGVFAGICTQREWDAMSRVPFPKSQQFRPAPKGTT